MTGILASINQENDLLTQTAENKVKNKKNSKAAGAARAAGAQTVIEKSLQANVDHMQVLSEKKDQEFQALNAQSNLNTLMDRLGDLSPEELFSEETFQNAQRLLPSLNRETYFNSLAPNSARRKMLTKQLSALPVGTPLPQQTLDQLRGVGINKPNKYMSLTTLAPQSSILGAVQRTAIGQAESGDSKSPLFAAGKSLQSNESAIQEARESAIKSEGKSSLRLKDFLINEDGEPDKSGKFIGTFGVDENGNPTNFSGIKSLSEIGKDELIKGRQSTLTSEIKKRKSDFNKLQLETDAIKRERDIAQSKIKKFQTRKLDIDSKDIPKIQAEINALEPIEKSIVKLNSIVLKLDRSGKLGAIQGRLADLQNTLAPNDPLLAEFNTIKSVITPFTARNLAKNVGAQSDRDIKLIEKALPMLKGNLPYNKKIVTSLLSLISDRKGALIKDRSMMSKISKELDFASAQRFKSLEEAEASGIPKGSVVYIFDRGKYRRARID